jgi:hypothetical protein
MSFQVEVVGCFLRQSQEVEEGAEEECQSEFLTEVEDSERM